jgi:hypothetical protein
MNTSNQTLVCPKGDALLYVELHGDRPHSVVTGSTTYDMDFSGNGYMLYHDSGSGSYDGKVNIGRMVDPSKPVQFWTAPGASLVDENRQPLTEEQAMERGFARIAEVSNPFLDEHGHEISEGRVVWCSVTGECWDEDTTQPSPFLQYLEHAGMWGGCGAGDDYIGEVASGKAIVDLARLMGATKSRRLANYLSDLRGTTNYVSFARDYHADEIEVTLPGKGRFTFRCKEDEMPMIEAAIAWIETVDGDKALMPAIKAVNWLNQTSHKLDLIRVSSKGVKIPVGVRKFWRSLRQMACHADHDHVRATIGAFLATLKK